MWLSKSFGEIPVSSWVGLSPQKSLSQCPGGKVWRQWWFSTFCVLSVQRTPSLVLCLPSALPGVSRRPGEDVAFSGTSCVSLLLVWAPLLCLGASLEREHLRHSARRCCAPSSTPLPGGTSVRLFPTFLLVCLATVLPPQSPPSNAKQPFTQKPHWLPTTYGAAQTPQHGTQSLGWSDPNTCF